MSVKIDRSGLDKIVENAKEVGGQHQVKLVDLMDVGFISTHTKFQDFDELLTASGFKVESTEDFAAIPEDSWDAFIGENTDFENWLEMQKAAGIEYFKAKLFRGLR